MNNDDDCDGGGNGLIFRFGGIAAQERNKNSIQKYKKPHTIIPTRELIKCIHYCKKVINNKN